MVTPTHQVVLWIVEANIDVFESHTLLYLASYLIVHSIWLPLVAFFCRNQGYFPHATTTISEKVLI